MTKHTKLHMLSLIALAFFMFFAAGSDDNSDNKTDPSKPTSSAPDSQEVLHDAKALDEKYGIAASLECASHADDYLKSIANYDFKWDDLGLLEHKFDRYRADVKTSGVLTKISDHVKLQNGFGAYQRILLHCDYDTQSNKVLGYVFFEYHQ